METETNKFELADIYSKLLVEWMEKRESDEDMNGIDAEDEGLVDADDNYEFVERQKERLKELCDKFESVVFERQDIDPTKVTEWMENLFDGVGGKVGTSLASWSRDCNCNDIPHYCHRGDTDIEGLRQSIERSCADLWSPTSLPFDADTVKTCIEEILVERNLSEEKQTHLREFLTNESILAEIADVLNMRWTDLNNWDWQAPDGNHVYPRRDTSGKYRIWMDYDVLQAILSHFIGLT